MVPQVSYGLKEGNPLVKFSSTTSIPKEDKTTAPQENYGEVWAQREDTA